MSKKEEKFNKMTQYNIDHEECDEISIEKLREKIVKTKERQEKLIESREAKKRKS